MLCCPQRWSRRKQARPEEILAAALECFVKHGYSATRMEDIAKHAGVTKGTVYLYYANKEELLKAVVRETLLPRVAEFGSVGTAFVPTTSAKNGKTPPCIKRTDINIRAGTGSAPTL